MEPEYKDWPVPAGPVAEMTYTSQATYFSVWAPMATAAKVNLYRQGQGGVPFESYPMSCRADGVWCATAPGDLKGVFYTFQVRQDAEAPNSLVPDGKVLDGNVPDSLASDGKALGRNVPNNLILDGKAPNGKTQPAAWSPETPGIFAIAVGLNGRRAQVLDLKDTDPEGWAFDCRPALKDFSDVLIYELHHRDFSMDAESGIKNKGKFLALTEKGTMNAAGLSTGLEHLVELGVNHVHLLPSFDFGSVDEACLTPSYNWGYDPLNYNVPEGSYATDPADPKVRIREFKQMIMALHRAGIRVVMDVVYNHVHDVDSSPFGRTAPGYFFRHKVDGTLANGSGCGNETASEMPMMRKFMVASVLYWIREYHIDGFRFDLMGIHDVETMQAIRKAVDEVDPSIFIYGEGWAAEQPALPQEQLAMKAHMQQLPGVAAFGDEMRDGLRGCWTDRKGGFLTGGDGHEESVKFGVVGAIRHPQLDYKQVNYSKAAWAAEPTQMISYVSCHDDLCLADRIKATAKKVGLVERIRLQKLALTAVLTSQGVPFIFCGDELLRDKKGVRNSYNSSDSINAIPWGQKTKYQDLFHYVKGLIALRKHHPAFRMGKTEWVAKHMKFLPVKAKHVVAYHLYGKEVGDTWKDIIVVLNSNQKAVRVEVPQGTYTVAVKEGKTDESGLGVFQGHSLPVPAQSALIIYR